MRKHRLLRPSDYRRERSIIVEENNQPTRAHLRDDFIDIIQRGWSCRHHVLSGKIRSTVISAIEFSRLCARLLDAINVVMRDSICEKWCPFAKLTPNESPRSCFQPAAVCP